MEEAYRAHRTNCTGSWISMCDDMSLLEKADNSSLASRLLRYGQQ
jgi:hypothetical protein